MAKLDYSIALNLLTDGVKTGAQKVESIFAKMKSTIVSTFGTIGIGLGIGTIGTSMLKQGKDFQATMAHIKGATNATSGEIKNMQDAAMKMGMTTNYSANEAAQGIEKMVTNGVGASDAINTLSETLEFAEAHSIDTAKAAEILTQQMKAFGMSVNEANAKKVSDVLSFAAPKVGGIDNLVESLREVAPVARTAGVGIQDTVSAVAGLVESGMDSSRAGTIVMQLITRLAAQTPQASKVFQEFGVKMNAATLKADGLSGTLKKLAQSGVGNNSNAMSTIFGKRAYAGAETLIANYQKVMALNGELRNSNGTTSRQAEDNSKTIEGSLKGIGAAWTTIETKMATKGAGPLASILGMVKGALTSIAGDVTGFVVKIGVIVAVVKGWKIFSGWTKNFAASSDKIIQDAVKMNNTLDKLGKKQASLERTRDAETVALNNADSSQIEAIQLKRNQTIAKLNANLAEQEKLQAEARVATERAAAVQTGTTWQAVQVKLKMGAEKLGTAFKSMWAQLGPWVIISGLVEIVSVLKDILSEHTRIKNMAAEYNMELKKAEQEYSPQLDKMERLKRLLNDNKLTVTQHKNIVGQINSLLGTRITNEKGLNKVLTDRIGILKQAADIEFYENQKNQLNSDIEDIKNKYGGMDPRTLRDKPGALQKYDKSSKIRYLKSLAPLHGYDISKDADTVDFDIKKIKEGDNHLDKISKSGKLVGNDQFGNLGGNAPIDTRTIDTSIHHEETAAEKAAKAAAEELANTERDFADNLKKLNWQYENGYITESDYLSQLKDLTKNTYMQSQTAKYALSRNSKLGGELRNVIAGKPSDKFVKTSGIAESPETLKDLFHGDDLIKFRQVQEQLNIDIEKYDRQLKAGAITWDEAIEGKHESYVNAYKNSSALNLNDSQKTISNSYRESAIGLELGTSPKGHVDKFDYDLSPREKLQAELDDATSKLNYYQEQAKSGIYQFESEINAVTLKKTNLSKMLDIEKFKQDIKDARSELEGDASSLINNIGGIEDAWEGVNDAFKNSNENAFKKALAIFQALLQTVRSIEDTANAISDIKFAIGRLAAATAGKKAAEKGAKELSGLLDRKKKDTKNNDKASNVVGTVAKSGASDAIGKIAGAAGTKLAEKSEKKNTEAMTKEAAAAHADASATMELASAKFFLAEADKGLAGAGLATLATTIMITAVKAAEAGSFANGGIIHGKPFDGSIAHVSDGEMIVNTIQQQKLWNAIQSGNLGGNGAGEITVRIKGRDLVGVLNNQNSKMNRV